MPCRVYDSMMQFRGLISMKNNLQHILTTPYAILCLNSPLVTLIIIKLTYKTSCLCKQNVPDRCLCDYSRNNQFKLNIWPPLWPKKQQNCWKLAICRSFAFICLPLISTNLYIKLLSPYVLLGRHRLCSKGSLWFFSEVPPTRQRKKKIVGMPSFFLLTRQ